VLGYITYFLSLLGITEYFKVSVALFVCMLVSNICAFPLIEVAGRRPLLLYGMIALTLIELVRSQSPPFYILNLTFCRLWELWVLLATPRLSGLPLSASSSGKRREPFSLANPAF
jgi:hypothetical protein